MEVVLGDGQLARLNGQVPLRLIRLLEPDGTCQVVMNNSPVKHPGAIELSHDVDYMYLQGFLDQVCPGLVDLELIHLPEA